MLEKALLFFSLSVIISSTRSSKLTMSDAPSHHWSTDFHPAQHLCHNNRLKSELHDKLKETYVMHVTLIRSKQRKTIKQTIHLITTLKFHMNLKDGMFLNSMIFYHWYVACFRCVGWYMSCGACWNPQIFVCFCALVVPGGGIRRHMTEIQMFLHLLNSTKLPPAPDFGALLKDINTQVLCSSVFLTHKFCAAVSF